MSRYFIKKKVFKKDQIKIPNCILSASGLVDFTENHLHYNAKGWYTVYRLL